MHGEVSWPFGDPVTNRNSRPKVPFLNEPTHIGKAMPSSPQVKMLTSLVEPFLLVSSQPSQSSLTSRATTPAVMTITPLRPQQTVATPSSHHDEKRPPPTGPVYTTESTSRLNLGHDVNLRDHSVVGQPSGYESEASALPRHHQNREDDGGVTLLGSSETINPKALRLPQDYRRFYP